MGSARPRHEDARAGLRGGHGPYQLLGHRDAGLLEDGTTGNRAAAQTEFSGALVYARDEAQIKKIAGELRKVGQSVDLPPHFGFPTHWKLIGPFDNALLVGFDAVYPPETKIDLDAGYQGKQGLVKWVDGATGHEYGMLDVNRLFGDEKGVVAYAFTDVS